MADSVTFKRLVIKKENRSLPYRQAVQVENTTVKPSELKDDQVLVKNQYTSVNASDIVYARGGYEFAYPQGLPETLYPGAEGIGSVVAVGPSVKNLKVGDSVCYFALPVEYGAYGEYIVLSEPQLNPVPLVHPTFLPLIVSGLTASIALEVGGLKAGQTVLVTAAAGATGSFAVQLAHLAGAKVIGTVSRNDKVDFLKKLGCDRVVNYKEENLGEVLKKEYPQGVDLVYECCGGDLYQTALHNLAIFGKLLVIGWVSGYQEGEVGLQLSPSVQGVVLLKSASVQGFFLAHYLNKVPEHTQKLAGLMQEGKLVSAVDPTEFKGIESVPDALDYLYSGKNKGKIVVAI